MSAVTITETESFAAALRTQSSAITTSIPSSGMLDAIDRAYADR